MGQRDSLTQQQPSVLRPIAFGLIGAPVGLVAGAFVGGVLAISAVEDRELGEAVFLGMLGFAAGAVLGEPWGVACGVHIGNRRHGNAVLDVVASTAMLAAGIGAAIAAEDARVLIAVPIAQTAAAVAVERATAQESPREGKTCP